MPGLITKISRNMGTFLFLSKPIRLFCKISESDSYFSLIVPLLFEFGAIIVLSIKEWEAAMDNIIFIAFFHNSSSFLLYLPTGLRRVLLIRWCSGF